jgi:hypothetical protein
MFAGLPGTLAVAGSRRQDELFGNMCAAAQSVEKLG